MQVQVRDCIFKSPVVGHQKCRRAKERGGGRGRGQNSLITVVVFRIQYESIYASQTKAVLKTSTGARHKFPELQVKCKMSNVSPAHTQLLPF